MALTKDEKKQLKLFHGLITNEINQDNLLEKKLLMKWLWSTLYNFDENKGTRACIDGSKTDSGAGSEVYRLGPRWVMLRQSSSKVTRTETIRQKHYRRDIDSHISHRCP